MASASDPTPIGSSAAAKGEPQLSVGSHPASIQALAKALAQLQKTAQKAQYPAEVITDSEREDHPARKKSRDSSEPADFVQFALMARQGTVQTSEREASRRYSGAKDFF